MSGSRAASAVAGAIRPTGYGRDSKNGTNSAQRGLAADESGSVASDDGEKDADEDDDESEEDSETSVDSDDIDGEDSVIPPRRRDVHVNGGPSRSSRSKQGARYEPYTPPYGMMASSPDVRFADSPFEYDALAAKKDAQIWAVRIPSDVKVSRLSALNVNLSAAGPSGTTQIKSKSYTLVEVGRPEAPGRKGKDSTRDEAGKSAGGLVEAMAMGGEQANYQGGEEMLGGMRLLVPRMSHNGHLFMSPIPITRQLLLTPDVLPLPSISSYDPLPSLLATTPPQQTTTPTSIHPEIALPAKRVQPSHLLKFRNQAVGFNTPGPGRSAAAASTAHVEDGEAGQERHQLAQSQNEVPAAPQEGKKKRKSEGGEGHKKKKVKVAS